MSVHLVGYVLSTVLSLLRSYFGAPAEDLPRERDAPKKPEEDTAKDVATPPEK